MASKRMIGLLCLAVLASAAGADTYHWQGGAGDWSDSNWWNETANLPDQGAPASTDEAYIGRHGTTGEDSDVTLDGTYTVTEGLRAGLMIGDRHSAQLTVGTGTSLTVNGLATLPSRTSEATTRLLNVSGGTLTVQNGATDGDFTMTSVHADDVATATVSAGTMTVQGVATIGFNGTGGDPGNTTLALTGGSFSCADDFAVYDSTVAFSGGEATFSDYVSLYGESTLSVTGDDATISLNSYLYFRTGSSADMEFTFDASGISIVDGAVRVYIYTGSEPTFTVDADALVGAQVGDEFVLLNYGLWRLDNITQTGSMADSITFVDAGSTITGDLVGDPDAKTVSYRITAVPEPATLSLVAMGAVAAIRRRRR